MEIVIGKSQQLIKQAQAIRYQVFTLEQKIPQALDLDGLDNHSYHVLVTIKQAPIATARLTLNGNGSSVIARVAVSESYRGKGIASKIVKALMGQAKSADASSIDVHAHHFLRGYYENLGFKFIKEVETVGDHQLIEMRYQIETV